MRIYHFKIARCAMWCHFFYLRALLQQFEYAKLKKSKTECFVWTDDKVELLFKVAIDYKVT